MVDKSGLGEWRRLGSERAGFSIRLVFDRLKRDLKKDVDARKESLLADDFSLTAQDGP